MARPASPSSRSAANRFPAARPPPLHRLPSLRRTLPWSVAAFVHIRGFMRIEIVEKSGSKIPKSVPQAPRSRKAPKGEPGQSSGNRLSVEIFRRHLAAVLGELAHQLLV